MDFHFRSIIPKVNNEPVFMEKSGITNNYIIQSMHRDFQLLPSEKLLIENYFRDELGFKYLEINFNSVFILFLFEFKRYCDYHGDHHH
jgi:hypothetical protein